MTRAFSIQIMTDDGSYILFYAQQETAEVALEKVRRVAASIDPWLELQDDERMILIVREENFHSAAFGPVPAHGVPIRKEMN